MTDRIAVTMNFETRFYFAKLAHRPLRKDIDININGGSANVWLGDTPICTTNCKEALELIVKTLADKFDAKLPARSEMIYDTVMGW